MLDMIYEHILLLMQCVCFVFILYLNQLQLMQVRINFRAIIFVQYDVFVIGE